MTGILITSAIIVVLCVVFNKISMKLGVPMLLFFILLGMVFGTDGIFKIDFENYNMAENICSAALIFIMFYGGFGTKWSEARPVAFKAVMLSSLGVVLTAVIVGIFCYAVLKIQLLESFLIGAVISSTDAASVFSVLRSKRLGLKYNTASLLEVESGSNDPCSYMLTSIILAIMGGTANGSNILLMIAAQIIVGIISGFIFAWVIKMLIKIIKPETEGFDAIFVLAMAVLAYSVPSALNGNGYLSVYITGIVLGNSDLDNKKSLVNFFDGITGLMQVLIFFLLGLLSFPSELVHSFLPGAAIALFLTFVARPAAIFAILTPLKCTLKQQLLVSWAGLRGAASVVFAIMIYTSPVVTENNIFNIVLCIVLLSIAFQGTLLPLFAKKLDMIDENEDVLKTFSDYSDEVEVNFIQLDIYKGHIWAGKKISDINIPPDTLAVLIIRNDENIVPKGSTVINEGDVLVLGARELDEDHGIMLAEKEISPDDNWKGRRLTDVKMGKGLVIMIKRGNNIIIPKGDTVLMEKDVLVINYGSSR